MFFVLLGSISAAGLLFLQDRYHTVRRDVNAWLPQHDDAYGHIEVAPDLPTQLPPLPYALTALEPDVSADTLRHHHGEHERRYLERSWEILNKHPRKRTSSDWEQLAHNANAVLLHELYWDSMQPEKRTKPVPRAIASRVGRDFGSMDRLREEFFDLAKSLGGSGWVILAWSPPLNRLVLLPVRNHNLGGLLGAVPLVVVDMWEHAWYLDRASSVDDYLEAFWRRVNWERARQRLSKALRLTDPTLTSLVA